MVGGVAVDQHTRPIALAGEPSVEPSGVVALGRGRARNDSDVERLAGFAEMGPEFPVGVGPVSEFALGLPAGVGVDEGRGVVAAGDGQLEVEVAAGSNGAAVQALGETVGLDAPAGEVGELLLFGGEPGQVRMIEDVVESKEAAKEDRRSGTAPVAAGFDGEGAIQGATADAREAVPAIGKRVFAGDPALHQAMDEPVGGVLAAVVETAELMAREHAGMETNEG